MTAIREFTKIKNHRLELDLPEDFNYDDVEVIIMPRNDTDDLSRFEKEVEKGMNSSISNKSHNEVFEDLKAKYGN